MKISLALGTALIAVLASHALTADAARPNFLIIIADDLRPTGPGGVLGGVPTPRLDTLQREGARFRNAYANFPACGPSRNSFLSGRRPETTGAVLNTAENIRHFIPDVVTLPEHFKRNGYTTIGMGKIFHSDQDETSWTTYFRYPRGIGGYQNQKPGERPTTEFTDASDEKYPDGWQARTASKWLAEHGGDGPFLMMVGLQKPHLAFVAPQRDFAAIDDTTVPVPQPQRPPRGAPNVATHTSFELRGYTDIPKGTEPFGPEKETLLRRGYGACVHFIDRQIGVILDALENSKLAANTHVIILGDHGFHFGENGIWGKDTLYEASLRTFLAARFAGDAPRFPQGKAIDTPVELLDIYPTLCGLAKLAPPYPLQGRDWFAAPIEGPVFSVVQRHGQMLGITVRDGAHRYVRWLHADTLRPGPEELYDYGIPAPETENLIENPAYREVRSKLSKLMDEHLAANNLQPIKQR